MCLPIGTPTLSFQQSCKEILLHLGTRLSTGDSRIQVQSKHRYRHLTLARLSSNSKLCLSRATSVNILQLRSEIPSLHWKSELSLVQTEGSAQARLRLSSGFSAPSPEPSQCEMPQNIGIRCRFDTRIDLILVSNNLWDAVIGIEVSMCAHINLTADASSRVTVLSLLSGNYKVSILFPE